MAGKAEKGISWWQAEMTIDQQMQDLDNKIANLDIGPEKIAELNNAISEIVSEANDKVNEVVAETKKDASKLSNEVWISVLASTVNNKSMSLNNSLVVSRENVVMKDISLQNFLHLGNV